MGVARTGRKIRFSFCLRDEKVRRPRSVPESMSGVTLVSGEPGRPGGVVSRPVSRVSSRRVSRDQGTYLFTGPQGVGLLLPSSPSFYLSSNFLQISFFFLDVRNSDTCGSRGGVRGSDHVYASTAPRTQDPGVRLTVHPESWILPESTFPPCHHLDSSLVPPRPTESQSHDSGDVRGDSWEVG